VCLDASLLDPASALEVWLPAAEAAWKRCLEIGECDRHEGHISGRGSYLAAQNLAVVYSALGQKSLSEQYQHITRVTSDVPAATHKHREHTAMTVDSRRETLT
jgi:hypothetical protein